MAIDGEDDGQLPDLRRIEEGHEITVYYQSQRSGNEVDRTGTATSVYDPDDTRVVRLHVEDRGRFKRQYVSLIETETKGGREIVAAFSTTAEAETDMDEPPKIGRTYTLNYSIEQTSFLGEVDRVVREDGPGPFLVTDGGRPEPAVLVARELHIPRAEAERLLSIQRSRRADDGE